MRDREKMKEDRLQGRELNKKKGKEGEKVRWLTHEAFCIAVEVLQECETVVIRFDIAGQSCRA
jgi:hypothetical protein